MNLRVVMPTLGRSPWWSDAVVSVAALPACHAVVVSPDASAVGLPGWVSVPDKGDGLYAAINLGFAMRGDWELGTYLNDDDQLVPQGVARARALLEGSPEIGAVFGRVEVVDSRGVLLTEIPVARRSADIGPLFAAGIISLAQPGTLFRRGLFEALEGFDQEWRAAGDMDFFMRAARSGVRFAFIDEVVARFRLHAGQISQRTSLVALEKRRLVEIARAVPGWRSAAWCSKWRFRCDNVPLYLARLRRHGLVSMETIYRSGGVLP